MKQVILIIGLMFSFAVANAQVAYTPTTEKPTNEQKAHNQALKMQKNLTLTNDQTVKVEALALSRLDAIAVIKSDATKTAEVQQKEIQALNDSKEKELQTILTPDQFTLYLQRKAAREARAQAQGAH